MKMFNRKPTHRRFNFSTPIRRKPSIDFSFGGLVFCLMSLFMLLAAVNGQVNLLFGVVGLMFGVLIVSYSISRMVLRKVQVRRLLPDHAVVGEPVTVNYEFTNEKRFWPSLSVSFAEMEGSEGFVRQPAAYMLHAAAGMVSTVPTEVVPKRRGLLELDHYQISTSFPFGFIKRASIRTERDTMIIYPAIGRVDPRLLSLCRAADKTGPTMRPRRGGTDEFYGVKEYRTGENPRWIYWRRSARTGVLVSKEMTQVSPPRLALLVDTFQNGRSAAANSGVEKTIAMAASLASHALEAGLLVGLMAWNGHWAGIQPQRGKRHRRDLLAVLARLPLNLDHDAQALLDASRDVLKSGMTAVLLTPRDMQMGLTDHGRGGMIVLSATGDQSSRWFDFPQDIDFAHCMPLDQEPTVTKSRKPPRVGVAPSVAAMK
jgi:uncharacterized protein (DUF58 family)